MQGISIREFARRDGCSDTMVHKAIKRQSLIAFDDGSIDPSLVGTPWRKKNIGLANRTHSEDISAPSGLVSFAEAQTRKENYLAKLRQLEFEVKSGRLVDADAVRKKVFDLARSERDALMNWPARAAPLLAAELGADHVRLAVALEKHVRDYLSERSEPNLHIAG